LRKKEIKKIFFAYNLIKIIIVNNIIMGTSDSKDKQFTIWDLEMIEISWSFVKEKQDLGLNTMIR